MTLPILRLKKNEDRRLRAGHLWIYSNEVDTKNTPIKNFSPGQTVSVEAHDKTHLGLAYVNPHSLIIGRLVSRQVTEHFDRDFLITRCQAALTWRQQFFKKPYYRLIFAESDGLPGLIVDRFDTTLVAQLNTAGMDAKKDILIDALRTVLPETTSILLRNDSNARTLEGLPLETVAGFGTPPDHVMLEENDTLFQAPIWQGQKTGWFYDHRYNRSRLKDYALDKTVLDVFSYLGGWGIQAAKAGATHVTAIDASAFATAAVLDNARLNQVEEKLSILQADAFTALKNLITQQHTFDIVILDPPAFVKKQKDLKEGSLAYQRINEMALRLLAPQGILITCSCSMHISATDFLQIIRRAALKTATPLQIIERGHQAQDHPVHVAIPETDYLKMVLARRG